MQNSQAFSITIVNGCLRGVEGSESANTETMILMNRCVQIVMAQCLARMTRNEGSPSADPQSLAPLTMSPALQMPAPQMSLVPAALVVADPPAKQADDPWLLDAINLWLKTGGVKFSKQSWKNSYAPTFRKFRELIGVVRREHKDEEGRVTPGGILDIRMSQIGRAQIIFFAESMKVFPARQGKRDDGVEAKVRLARALAENQKHPSLDSVDKGLGHIKPFIAFAKLKGYVPIDVLDEMLLATGAAAAALTLEQTNSGKKPGAVALNEQELCRLFGQSQFAEGAMKADWRYWVPLICLHQGFRVSEASQIYTDDIIVIQGVHCISLIPDAAGAAADEEDAAAPNTRKRKPLPAAKSSEEYRRRLKNGASRRIVPIHPRLIELGFLEFVAGITRYLGDPAHIFKLTWEPKSMFGRRPSEILLDLIASAGMSERRRKVGHSLRSNFSQALEKTLPPKAISQRLMGHSTGKRSETSYGEIDEGASMPFVESLGFLERVSFPITVPTWPEILAMRSAAAAASAAAATAKAKASSKARA